MTTKEEYNEMKALFGFMFNETNDTYEKYVAAEAKSSARVKALIDSIPESATANPSVKNIDELKAYLAEANYVAMIVGKSAEIINTSEKRVEVLQAINGYKHYNKLSDDDIQRILVETEGTHEFDYARAKGHSFYKISFMENDSDFCPTVVYVSYSK